jgi:hypothetical protein
MRLFLVQVQERFGRDCGDQVVGIKLSDQRGCTVDEVMAPSWGFVNSKLLELLGRRVQRFVGTLPELNPDYQNENVFWVVTKPVVKRAKKVRNTSKKKQQMGHPHGGGEGEHNPVR